MDGFGMAWYGIAFEQILNPVMMLLLQKDVPFLSRESTVVLEILVSWRGYRVSHVRASSALLPIWPCPSSLTQPVLQFNFQIFSISSH